MAAVVRRRGVGVARRAARPADPLCRYCKKPMPPHFKEIREPRSSAQLNPVDSELREQAKRFAIGEGRVSVVFNERIIKTAEILGYGYLDNGLFCTLRCGFRWAVRLIKSTSDEKAASK